MEILEYLEVVRVVGSETNNNGKTKPKILRILNDIVSG